jgi:hypothetical protein
VRDLGGHVALTQGEAVGQKNLNPSSPFGKADFKFWRVWLPLIATDRSVPTIPALSTMVIRHWLLKDVWLAVKVAVKSSRAL